MSTEPSASDLRCLHTVAHDFQGNSQNASGYFKPRPEILQPSIHLKSTTELSGPFRNSMGKMDNLKMLLQSALGPIINHIICCRDTRALEIGE